MGKHVGAVEAGGTKIVCAIGSGPDDLEEIRFATQDPETTIARICEFFRGAEGIEAVGVGTFGPAGVDPTRAETFGKILNTPKPGWKNTDLITPLREALGVPIHFDTDANAAAFGEGRWGAARNLHTYIYVTVGTGIGGGAVIEHRILHGALHPEIGHLRIPHDTTRDPFPGCCPFHGDCLEGLACGPAIEKRWSASARDLPADHEAWHLQAHYLGLALANLSLSLAPQLIILGGGVMEQQQLFPMIREQLAQLLNGYLDPPEIAPPALGNRAGILGSLALALR